MSQLAAALRPGPLTPGNIARLEWDNLERFGVYERLYFQGQAYTNLEEARLAGSLASVLVDLGIGAGDRVLVMMPGSPELNAAFQAIWMIGGVVVPVMPQWTAEEVAEILRGGTPTAALTIPQLSPRIAAANAGIGTLKHLLAFGESDSSGVRNIRELVAAAPPIETPADRSPGDLAALFYTSGTTGSPKGVMLTHGNIAAAVESAYRLNPDPGSGAMLQPLPLTHVFGLFAQTMANRWGWETVLLRQFDPVQALEQIQSYRVRFLPVVPTMLVYLLHHPERPHFDTSSLSLIIAGGAALPSALSQATVQVFHCRVYQGYGLSESSSLATGYEFHSGYRPGSAGRAAPGVKIQILDGDNQPLPPHATGEICLSGGNIMSGYWGDPAATQQALQNGWLHTGDLGYLDEEGYLFITDRKKDLIIKGGENVSPAEIEEALKLHPAVFEAAVIGIPDEVYGEEICALVQLKPGAQVSEEALRQHVAGHVTKFKLPARVAFLAAMPRNSSGKILKRQLRAMMLAKPLAKPAGTEQVNA